MSASDEPLVPSLEGESVVDSTSPVSVPAAFIDKCFIPYDAHVAPSLNGVPIVLAPGPPELDGPIALAPGLLAVARNALESEFKLAESTSADGAQVPTTLRVSALCGAHLDSPVAVDAAARYLAHELEADLVVMDPEDLYAGEDGLLGADFAAALWHLYSKHYEVQDAEEELTNAQDKAEEADDALTDCKKTVEKCRAAVEERSSTAESPIDQKDEKLVDLLTDLAEAKDALEKATGPYMASNAELEGIKIRHAAEAKVRDDLTAAARAWFTALIGMRSATSPTTSETRTTELPRRRRMLYLRDFGTMSYVSRPILQTLLRAIHDTGLPIIAVAGIWRYERLPDDENSVSRAARKSREKHSKYLDAFESSGHLKDWLKRKFPAAWREAKTDNDRFNSLSHMSSSTFSHRFAVRQLGRRGASQSMVVDEDATLVYEQVLAVGLVGASSHALAGRWSKTERERRLVAHNLGKLTVALRDIEREVKLSSLQEMLYDSSDADVSKERAELTKSLRELILTPSDAASLAARLAPWLPVSSESESSPSPTAADFLHALEHGETVAQEVRAQISAAREKIESSEKGAGAADPIVEKVKSADDLDQFEQSLLGAIVDPTTIRTVYADVCIQPHIIETLRSVVSLPLLFPEAYSVGILGKESMSGVLLYGPPGTGKTMVCRALAKESGARMLQIQASNMKSKWHSESEKLIHATFTLARRLGPCVVFIDEIDALFGRRGDRDSQIHRSMLTEFMQEMDGLKTSEENKNAQVIVVGATNRPQDLDDAVLRRLPRRVLVDLPGLAEREKILTQYLRGESVDDTVDTADLASRTEYFSGSDIKHLVFSAALAAFKDTVPDLWKTMDQGVERWPLPTRVLSAAHFDHALQEITASSAANMDAVYRLRTWGGNIGRAL
ncbi:AAA-domain-containing protein [Exidia glandulosa HHB12029]|uniref:AAA-domain-containing protein n=1 Tax=Exidia glandulosa HHB12029 TaxID=1314781 RepID=A0A165FLZ4_EXIGL|nr:AAA-domain-containing protein [Exidia glandulosa HHB12029]